MIASYHIRLLLSLFFLLSLLACQAEQTSTNDNPTILRLATTTSTADSGLLDAIVPDFEGRYHAQVDIVAVGTGQAIALGENGDADVIFVHARAKEEAFIDAGYGINRRDVMYNDFVIVGPPSDPATIQGTPIASDALAQIAQNKSLFASRGDDSGTHSKEKGIWEAAGITPSPDMAWYKSLGQGMGATLNAAHELGAYTLTDRGTFLAQQDKLSELTILVGGTSIADNQDPFLRNPYGIIPVNPERHPNTQSELAEQFATWLTNKEIQAQIGEFGKEKFGQPLFYPNSGS